MAGDIGIRHNETESNPTTEQEIDVCQTFWLCSYSIYNKIAEGPP